MPSALFSPKLELTNARGFALRSSGQPLYRCEWHVHDCAMLLWPETGGLSAAWEPESGDGPGAACSVHLSRSTGILLPAAVAHNTKASTRQQRHGELYLAPQLLRGRTLSGAFRLDGPTLAMLDALLSPSLDACAAEPLVDALLKQIVCSRGFPLRSEQNAVTLGRRLLARFDHALRWEEPMPTVEAVAHELGVSQRQLERACRQEMGATPIDLRRRLLADRARQLMTQGLTLAQTSLQLGFATSGHLTRLLRATAH